MKKPLVSYLWAMVGGFTAFVMGCWLGAMLVSAILFCFGKTVAMAELHEIAGMGILLGLWPAFGASGFSIGKAAGLSPEK